MKIKKNDNILVISGKDRAKQGKVERVLPKSNKVMVTGVNMSKHHLKPSRKNPQGGIVDKPALIDVSNVVIVCPRCSKPTRIGFKITGDSAKGGKKIRICKKCHESLDQNA